MPTNANHAKIPVFILAGGRGTRLSEETHAVPKPMVEIGDLPILVHLMRWYYSFGFNDFVICAGYRQWEIKQYFMNYEARANHLVMDHRQEKRANGWSIFGRNPAQEKWRVRVIDTGLDTQTGGRIARAFDEVADEKFTDFAITYGDGLSDVDLAAEFAFHKEHGKVGTVLGVAPLARFGELDVGADNRVKDFLEKPQSRQGLINGGFFFFKREFRKHLDTAEDLILERKPMRAIASEGQLVVRKHTGFWHPMDTLRDKQTLQSLWETGKAPWLPARS
jgi:glucose-1-phosphate cytidylyltransferase